MAIVEGIKDGTIDVVHSDHTPQDVDMKRHPFADAADGAIGLETLLAALLRRVHDGAINLSDAVRVLSNNPAQLLGLETGSLKKDSAADITLIDINEPWVLTKDILKSRSKNTAFEDAQFTGLVCKTYVDGREAYSHC